MYKAIIYFFLIAFFVCLGCKAQSQVYPIDYAEYSINGAYYKDTNSDLDPFKGTWKYTNGSTSLTITLQKKEMMVRKNAGAVFFEDFIVGEYKYFENGIEKINTLPQLSLDLRPFQYNITGNLIYHGTQNSLKASFSDPNISIDGMSAAMFFERADSNGQLSLKVSFIMTDGPITIDNQPLEHEQYTVPFGEYLLIKQ